MVCGKSHIPIKRKLQHGKNLLQLCGSLGLYIVNGRLRGDSFGQLTYSSALSSSMVDYAITDLDQTFLRAFTVKPLTPLSDHSQTTVYLKRTAANDNRQKPRQMYKLRPPLRWAQDSTEKYLHAIDSQEIHTLLDSFLSNIYPLNRE
ncbi:hypothetical protein SRHO_G00344570 [Serrasalmus rhombeus]